MIGQYTYFFSRHILSWFIILENIISPYIIYYSYITWFCQCPSKRSTNSCIVFISLLGEVYKII